MIVKDLIQNKDYDYISWRVVAPDWFDEPDVWVGACKSINGELIPLDGDSYSEHEEVIQFEEWSNERIENGLTVIVLEEWV